MATCQKRPRRQAADKAHDFFKRGFRLPDSDESSSSGSEDDILSTGSTTEDECDSSSADESVVSDAADDTEVELPAASGSSKE